MQLGRNSISTHDLTRRSTIKECTKMGRRTHFNSRPHEEVDLYGVKIACVYVISTHDLTRRSTRFAPFACENVRNISTHDLTRRSTEKG